MPGAERGRRRRWSSDRSRSRYGARSRRRCACERRPRIGRARTPWAPSCPGRGGYDPADGDSGGRDTLASRRSAASATIVRSAAIVAAHRQPGGSSVASDVDLARAEAAHRRTIPRPAARGLDVGPGGVGRLLHRASRADEHRGAAGARSPARSASTPARSSPAARSKRLGVTTEYVTSGANADIYSPLTTFTPAQRPRSIEASCAILRGFLDKTAGVAAQDTRRSRTRWRRAVCGPARRRERGLVDRLRRARRGDWPAVKSGPTSAADVGPSSTVIRPPPDVLRKRCRTSSGAPAARGASASPLRADDLSPQGPARRIASATAPRGRLFRRGEPLALMPFAFVEEMKGRGRPSKARPGYMPS